MSGYKPAHKLILTKAKGKFNATCVCGWNQTGRTKTEEEAVTQYNRHHGIFEKSTRR